jgi:hypothetical protein
MEIADKFFTPRQCARELGITLDRVYVLLWGGRLAASKNGRGEWQIPAEVVERRKAFITHRSWERPQEASVSV